MKAWILAASAVMGAIVLFAGIPLTTWAKRVAAKRAAWATVVLWLLPAGALATFLVAAWNGLTRLASADLSDAAAGAQARAEAVSLAVESGAYGVAATLLTCVALLAIGQFLPRRP